MNTSYTYKPIQFFTISLLGTALFSLIAVFCSYQTGLTGIQFLFMFMGLFVPSIIALCMIFGSKNRYVIANFFDRLRLYRIKVTFLPIIFLLMPIVVLLATSISLLFNQPTTQFYLSPTFIPNSTQNILSLGILFLAPLVEEIGWRGYGVDSIRAYCNLFNTTLLFAFIWMCWHLPLLFIQGSYPNELCKTNILYVSNYYFSMLPATVLLNWIYYKNNRSIVAVVLLHFMFNVSSVLFQTEQYTKCIITVLLSIISIGIIVKDKRLFFSQELDNKLKFM